MKKQTDKEWAAKLLRAVVVRGVQCVEQEAKLSVHLAQKEAEATLRTAAEVRRRLGMR